jgi:tetratricopeptide (TPR) repeat protein
MALGNGINRSVLLCSTFCLLALLGQNASASNTCRTDAGRFVSIQGLVEVQPSTGGRWESTTLQHRLCQGDSIRVGVQSRAAIALVNDAILRLDENTTMRLVNVSPQEEDRSLLDLVRGGIMSFSRKPKRLDVSTPYLNGSIEGTEFAFLVGEGESQLTVFEGTVIAANAMGALPVSGGQTAVAAEGQAPQPRILVRPRDAVQWSLYYPPILAAGGKEGAGLQEAAALLAVGRVDEALARVDQAISQQTDAGLAHALRSVIRVTQNDVEAALADAAKAVSLTDAAAARIALSYAQQANFQIESARNTLLATVEQHPEDALAWARLAELWLMLGERGQALAAARTAEALAPELGRAQLVLGFNALAMFRNDEARAAFERAVELSSADPLGHLGLGLSKISSGQLPDGRRDLEAAVALDSSSALLRAYLGKAYFEERRYPLDAQQYDIAKELDPRDPTAFFYSGILKQTVNRPVEAVRDLEQAIALNDDRAVYRSRLLLDQDRAARGTSLARAFNDLGFEQLGLNAAAESLALDPGNASAHRFLSDSYQNTRRREISRVSELLQAQMLQDININPVQPSVSATNLNIATIGGPATPGFNEFTPLFQRNQAQFNASASGGNNGTLGAEAVASGVYDRFSLSLGGLTYETDGWRPNNDLEQNVYNIFGQWAITPELNAQAEFGHRNSEEGDLAFNFDPESFRRDQRIDRDQDTARLGLRYAPAPGSTFLLSYIGSDREEQQIYSESLGGPFFLDVNARAKEDGSQYEGQYLGKGDRWNVVTGVAASDVDRDINTAAEVTEDGAPVFAVDDVAQREIEHRRGYVYANVRFSEPVTWTLGASYDDYQEQPLEIDSFNPKLGVQWNLTDQFLLRAAAFRVVKPALVSNRTLEPTQVAGFNQLFDDINATRSSRYGGGFDWRMAPTLAIGGETTWRDIEEPVFGVDFESGETSVRFEDRDEQYHQLYLYWTPSDRVGVNAKVVYDLFESEIGDATELSNLPERVRTLSLPVGVSYFAPSGLFGTLGATYVDQKVRRSEFSTQGQGDDQFFLVDVALGYRLPKRAGVLSLGINNLFDRAFNYQDDSYRQFRDEPAIGPYFPQRTIIGRITLNF